jgi:hypothetical protein
MRTTNIIQLGGALHLNAVDDEFPGGGDSPGLVPGQLGAIFHVDTQLAADLADTSVAVLYAGLYQYVKFKASPTTAAARGLVVGWSDQDAYEVSVDAASDAAADLVAGVALNPVTSGQHGFIQIAGLADVKFLASTTKATPAVGNLVVAPLDADNGEADVLGDATAVVFGTAAAALPRMMGRLHAAVDGNDFGLVQLGGLFQNVG